MKKLLISLIAGTSFSLMAGTSTVTVPPAGISNLLSVVNGYANVNAITVVATTATNATVALYDVSTNSLVNVTAAYTNVISYVTNNIFTSTNFYGKVTTLTNQQMFSVANPVAAATNAAPIRTAVTASASTATTMTGINYKFLRGCWVTNTGSGNAQVIIQYTQ